MAAYRRGRLYELMVAELHEDPNQPRKIMDEEAMVELVASIARMGVIDPVLFSVDRQANKLVVAGKRRVEAARRLGMATIPGIYVSSNQGEIALVENLLREDLTPVELAEGMKVLMVEQEYNQEQLAAVIGKSQNSISELLSLNRLPQEVRDDCRGERTITKSVLIKIAKKKPEQMVAAYQAHKVKLNRVKAPRVRKAVSVQEKHFAILVKTADQIKAIDSSAWSAEERSRLKEFLNSLKAEIELQLRSLELA